MHMCTVTAYSGSQNVEFSIQRKLPNTEMGFIFFPHHICMCQQGLLNIFVEESVWNVIFCHILMYSFIGKMIKNKS